MKVSVVIPTYKRPDFLQRLLVSISKQTLLPDEVIIVDDCSDNQAAYLSVIESFKEQFTLLQYYSLQQNSGAPSCRNIGIQKASGDWIALVDDDDEWLNDKLQRQVELAKASDPNLSLIYTWTDIVESSGEIIPFYREAHQGKVLSELINHCFIPSPSVMARRTKLLEVGGFDPTLPSCQDWDMWVRMVKAGIDVACVEHVCTLYHKHGNASIGLSPRAKDGYRLFYSKHFFLLLRYGQWRHLIRYFKLATKALTQGLK